MMVKVRIGDLRRLVSEEYMRGVPEWQLREATDKYVDEIRGYVKRFILMNKSQFPKDQREAVEAANSVLDELNQKVYAALEDTLWEFIQQV